METLGEDLIKVLLAILVGGLIGAERELMDKHVGFRTLICICVGATLFTIFSVRLGGPAGDPARIAAAVVTGVGFLGAGAILRSQGRVLGFTTAATVWLVAALGLGIGGGFFVFTLISAITVLIVLALFPMIETQIDRLSENRLYSICFEGSGDKSEECKALFEEHDLTVIEYMKKKLKNQIVGQYRVKGSLAKHQQVIEVIISDPSVKELNY